MSSGGPLWAMPFTVAWSTVTSCRPACVLAAAGRLVSVIVSLTASSCVQGWGIGAVAGVVCLNTTAATMLREDTNFVDEGSMKRSPRRTA